MTRYEHGFLTKCVSAGVDTQTAIRMLKKAALSEDEAMTILKSQGLSDDAAKRHYRRGVKRQNEVKRRNRIIGTALGALAGGGLSLASDNDMLGAKTSPAANAAAAALLGAAGGNLTARLGNATGSGIANLALRHKLRKLKKQGSLAVKSAVSRPKTEEERRERRKRLKNIITPLVMALGGAFVGGSLNSAIRSSLRDAERDADITRRYNEAKSRGDMAGAHKIFQEHFDRSYSPFRFSDALKGGLVGAMAGGSLGYAGSNLSNLIADYTDTDPIAPTVRVER